MQSWVFTIEYVSCDFIWGFFMLYIIFWRGSNCVRNFHVPPFCSQRQPKPAPPLFTGCLQCRESQHRHFSHAETVGILQELHNFAVCGWEVLTAWPLVFSGGLCFVVTGHFLVLLGAFSENWRDQDGEMPFHSPPWTRQFLLKFCVSLYML